MRIFKNTARIRLVLLIITSLLPVFSYAQKANPEKGKIEIIQDQKVDILVSKHIQINLKQEGLDGFRIQVFSDSGNSAKADAMVIQEDFRAKHPEVETYLTFKSPNYRVRVGDFRSRLDAQHFLNEISTDYPNAFTIDEKIQLPKD